MDFLQRTHPCNPSNPCTGFGLRVGCNNLDTSGLEAIRALYERLRNQGGTLMFADAHENARAMLERSGLLDEIGEENFFWSSDQAIVEAERRGCAFCK